jgi:pyruvate formate lyase activating enzyme
VPYSGRGMEQPTGTIFNIQRFSLHDGPGIRTTVFLKGCTLQCFWCHNPEGQKVRPEIQFFPARCLQCGACVKACEHGGHVIADGQHTYRREVCVVCGACVDVCPAGGLERAGRRATVDEVLREVLADRAFYRESGGGVTLSGGEPLVQREFTLALLERSRAEGVHTAIETAGHVPWADLARVLPATDLVLMDLKQLDPEKHRAATGVGNERILANARQLAATNQPVVFRVPVIPTVNDTVADIGALAGFVRELIALRDRQHGGNGHAPAALALELLPFHCLGEGKYRSLGLDYPAASLRPPPPEKMTELRQVVAGILN